MSAPSEELGEPFTFLYGFSGGTAQQHGIAAVTSHFAKATGQATGLGR